MYNSEELLEARGINKAFPGVLAVDDVSLDLRPGEIHGIVGQNGAGKTTLMRVLAGLSRPDKGEIIVDGKHVQFASPADAIHAGIGIVQQHFALVPTMTVAENLALAQAQLESRRTLQSVNLKCRIIEEKAREISEKYDLTIDPSSRIEELSVGIQQKVELLRTLYLNTCILILDEPTAVLTPLETERLMLILRRLTKGGTGIFFVSHHLQEVLDFTDRISVMRNGQLIDTVKSSDASKSLLAKMMIGQVFYGLQVPEKEFTKEKEDRAVLDTRDLWLRSDRGTVAVKGVSFQIHSGEILGVAGLDGNGQIELADAIAGLRSIEKGKVFISGEEITNNSVKQIQQKGLSYIPPDRQLNALALDSDIAHNLVLKSFHKRLYSRWGILNNKAIRENAQKLIREYDIRAMDCSQKLSTLSGGNQQKIVLARELQDKPIVLISCYATRGLDLAAVATVQRKILEAKENGTAVLFFSNEIEELLEVSDRVAVMNAGKISGIVDPTLTTEEEIGLLMGQ
jgi:simple sugar transport system ATP-binding protein